LRVLVENPDQLVGHETLRLVAKGRPLVLTDWRQIAVVKRGQRVKLVLLGAGFEVVSSGTALDEAQTGGKVRVRMPEGKVVEGVAGVDGAVTVLLN
jgi:flagella basal body P-ring formation protein FlgA